MRAERIAEVRLQNAEVEILRAKKSGLTVATLISTPNPVSQVLW
jgi:hypothetical protein